MDLDLTALADLIQSAMDNPETPTITVPDRDGDPFAKLTQDELEALSNAFRTGRQACRKVMRKNWHDKGITETYRQIVVEFQNNDPLFTCEINRMEMKEQ